ncbi:ABC transporter ATP-binding protein [Nocardioides yefusunii]|uniref:ABC transporter ATP-binding protein n=1 Tax=Nocardioides yefusunii TaxID=2500546 RepID=A0ABW1QUI8_9ACTN|nr:ABC transporter ATP-binding protein [Nocardioides yefusunii]
MNAPAMGHGHLAQDRSVKKAKVERTALRRVLSFAGPHRRTIGFFLALTVLDALLVAVPPLLMQRIIDDGVADGDTRLVVWLAVAVGVVAVVSALLTVGSGLLSSRIGEGLIYDLRTKVFSHVQRLPLAFFTQTQTGALVSRLNNDVIGAQRAFTSTLQSTVANLIGVVVVGATMLVLSWQVTLACVAMVPFLLIASKWVGGKVSGLTRAQMDGNADMGNTMTERFNIGGALLLKLFGRPTFEDAHYAGKAAVVRDLGVKISLYTRSYMAVMALVPALATALVYGIGGVMAINASLTVGTVVALSILLTRLLGPLQALANVRIDIMTALVSFDRVFEILDLPSSITEKPDAITLAGNRAGVEFRDVHFAYPASGSAPAPSLGAVAQTRSDAGVPVLNGVSFTARPGEMIALVGPSGAGKSTLTHLVARLYDVDSGQVRVGDVDVRDLTSASLTDTVGYVTQDAHMFHDTIRANLAYARRDADEAAMWDALERAQVADLVRNLPAGLDTVVGDRGYRLSGGERQRLAIARLLLKSPAVVVLDEATAHLDSESEAAVQRALDAALEGRTSLVVAHRLSTVRNADQILVVDGGKIVEQGTHLDLLGQRGLYAELHATQFEGQSAV